jgi:hypothetical protein
MLWVNKDVEAEQVPVDSPDITAAIIRLPDLHIETRNGCALFLRHPAAKNSSPRKPKIAC